MLAQVKDQSEFRVPGEVKKLRQYLIISILSTLIREQAVQLIIYEQRMEFGDSVSDLVIGKKVGHS